MAGGAFIRGADGVLREPPGHAALWQAFGLSRASWVALPRSLMHEMPDDWQARMALLLNEFYSTYNAMPQYEIQIQLKQDGRFAAMPKWLNYRHPDVALIESFKVAGSNG